MHSMFDAIFQHSYIGIIISNKAGVMQSVNPFAATLFGYRAEELIGLEVEVLIPKELREGHIPKRLNYLEKPTPRAMGIGFDLEGLKKDGMRFPVELSLSSFEKDGELQIISFINGIAERKLSENKLKELAAELESKVEERTEELSQALMELNQTNLSLVAETKERKSKEEQVRKALKQEKDLSELKSRFVSMASHEFRTPLGGILTSASLLERYTTPETANKRDRHIKTIKKSVKNLTLILNDFLSLDKLEQGIIGTNPTQFKIKEFAEELVEETRDLSEKGQVISYAHSGDDAPVVQDRDMLRNVLVNLISNAMKYSPAESIVEIETIQGKEQVTLIVKDHGIGIPEAEQKQLFQRFFRAKNATNIQGTGLGLNICKRYIDLMNGTVAFKSVFNEGTTFTVQVPTELKYEKNTTD
jgi:PAS domain S-box-containing protein